MPATDVNQQPVIELRAGAVRERNAPHFLRAQLLPGRGMNVFQIEAFIPGRGPTPLLASPSLDEAKKQLEGNSPDDKQGNLSFSFGGAILAPFANRIRGQLASDGKTLTVKIMDSSVALLVNWRGKNPGAEPHAMHGLILDRRMDQVSVQGNRAVADLDAANFGDHWPSKTALHFDVELEPYAFHLRVTATNSGTERLPFGIGWHPYFRLPSGLRNQAKLFVPARERTLVNNYDDVFPTGLVEAVEGTVYDFNSGGGKALDDLFLDDCFLDLMSGKGTEIRDPAYGYGLRVIPKSPSIRAFQVYAPPNRDFVAIEPQYNLGDPYGLEWKGRDTGMITLAPGETTTYAVDLELFEP